MWLFAGSFVPLRCFARGRAPQFFFFRIFLRILAEKTLSAIPPDRLRIYESSLCFVGIPNISPIGVINESTQATLAPVATLYNLSHDMVPPYHLKEA